MLESVSIILLSLLHTKNVYQYNVTRWSHQSKYPYRIK